MNRVFILKDVAYATKKTGGTITSIKEIEELAQGAFAAFNDKGALIDIADVRPSLLDIKEVQMAVGRLEDTQVIQLPKTPIVDINFSTYVAAEKEVTVINIPSTIENGEGGLLFKDNSFTNRYGTRRVDASYIKKSTQSVSNYTEKLVEIINKSTWLTAVKSTNSTDGFDITVTASGTSALETRTIFNTAKTGILEDITITKSGFIYGEGLGEDVLQLEKDFSVEEGNGNYTEYTTDFYRRTMEAIPSVGYDVVNILWEGTHSSPTRSTNVMRNRLAIALPTAGTNMTLATIQNITEEVADNSTTETGEQ